MLHLRLARDYKTDPEVSEHMIRLAAINGTLDELTSNWAIYSAALDIMVANNELFAAGHPANWEGPATVTP